LELSMIILEDC